uniref:Uncharacterized protein n=1 Tax=Anopheles darlingi TaxID=43151 RepID=A0A2M4DFC1_ANODA
MPIVLISCFTVTILVILFSSRFHQTSTVVCVSKHDVTRCRDTVICRRVLMCLFFIWHVQLLKDVFVFVIRCYT